jgi:predicted lipid-binding transport protein (Tim44 family)
VDLFLLIFAVVAAFLIYRLNSVLGTRNGAERQRPNPFAPGESVPQAQPGPKPQAARPAAGAAPKPALPPQSLDQLVDAAANKDGRVETGLIEIGKADPHFDLNGFMQGARTAFEVIATAYNRGDLDTLKPLLSPKLFADFSAGVRGRESAGHSSELVIHRIKAARVTEAHMGGAMAYVTVSLEVEETATTRDKAGQVVSGSADHILTVHDIWTFTRDTRHGDPNWIVIETRTLEQ